MAGFSNNDIEKSPWAVGKAWVHDTLAYRGSNIWKCSVPDRGEKWANEWMKSTQSIYKETGRKWPSMVPLPYQFPLWLQPNPAFNDGPHFRFKHLQTSHLTSNLICQHPFLSYLVHMQLSWYCNMVWKRDMLDTALPIIGMLCNTEAGQQHGNEQIHYRKPLGFGILLSCGWHWEQSAC